MFSLSQIARVVYAVALSLALFFLLDPAQSQAQKGFGVSAGYRGTPALPTIAIPMINASNGGLGGFGGGGLRGIGGNVGGANLSGSFSTQIIHVNLGSFFPNDGRIIGLPPAPMMPMVNNWLTDSSGAPWALITSAGLFSGGGGVRGGGIGGGAAGRMGNGGGAAGLGGGMNSFGGGMGGGFAGKGLGGFNGRKGL